MTPLEKFMFQRQGKIHLIKAEEDSQPKKIAAPVASPDPAADYAQPQPGKLGKRGTRVSNSLKNAFK